MPHWIIEKTNCTDLGSDVVEMRFCRAAQTARDIRGKDFKGHVVVGIDILHIERDIQRTRRDEHSSSSKLEWGLIGATRTLGKSTRVQELMAILSFSCFGDQNFSKRGVRKDVSILVIRLQRSGA